jgi:hypothetical protein
MLRGCNSAEGGNLKRVVSGCMIQARSGSDGLAIHLLVA